MPSDASDVMKPEAEASGRTSMVAPTRFELAISALRGRRPKPLDDGAKVAGVEGVEPSHTEPESAVLPLDDTPMCLARLLASLAWRE